jgi:hypothetical protein
MSVISALRRLRQKDSLFVADLGYVTRPCLKNKKLLVVIFSESYY